MNLNLTIILVLTFIENLTSIFIPDEKDIKAFIRASHSLPLRPELRSAFSPAGIVNSRMGNEADARYFFNANGLSYCPNPVIFATNGTYGRNLSNEFRVLEIFEDKKYDTLSYVAELKEKKELIMTFRGSVSQKNWDMNLKLWQVPLCDEKDIKVHFGFKTITDSMAPLAIEYLKKLFTEPKYKDYNLVVTGHSLGGGLATLSVLKYQEALQLPWNRISLITYGSPRVGNKLFADLVNFKPVYSTRVVNQWDPIPQLPDRDYSHIQSELYIKDGQSVMCATTTYEDSNCSSGARFVINRPAHSTAWGFLLDNKYC